MPLRKKIAGIIQAVPVSTWNRWVGKARPVLPKRWRVHLPGDKIYKFSELLSAREADEIYAHLVSYWKDPANLAIGAQQYPELPLKSPESCGRNLDFTRRMMLLDLMTYLPDDILVKVDRASMAVSLEARAPLLDHRLVEWTWKLPMKLKIRNGQGKYLLRKILSRYIPDSLMERPKTGFGIPLGEWLRGPLREWAEAQLSENRMRREQFLNPAPIRAAWSAHLRGDRNEQYRLWAVLMFQAWLEKWDQPLH
jgi:asparagine synthase (glutamine-hydrolysing)